METGLQYSTDISPLCEQTEEYSGSPIVCALWAAAPGLIQNQLVQLVLGGDLLPMSKA